MKVDYSKYLDRIKFWKSTIENVKDFTGTSPPSVFVGKAFYPKIYVGLLSPPRHDENAMVLDSPEKWYEQRASIDQVLNYRGQMVYSRFKTVSIKPTSGKLIDVLQEVAMSKSQADVEISLKKNPRFEFSFSKYSAPVGNPAPMEKARLTENPKVDIKVEKAVGDSDLKAAEAVSYLYRHVPVSNIQKIFSVGLLGVPMQRKFVPTRWSITSVDSIISQYLIDRIKSYQELDDFRLFSNTYLGNHFEVLLIPGPWRFEVIEAWNMAKPSLSQDWEDYWGRKDYASQVAGGYYSVRLAVSEFLDKIKRQASVLVLREVYDEYDSPLGVWVVREASRGCFNNSHASFSDINSALVGVSNRMKINSKTFFHKSEILKRIFYQRSLRSFINRP